MIPLVLYYMISYINKKIGGEKMETTECLKCGHVWTKRVDEPTRCPKCQSTTWGLSGNFFDNLDCNVCLYSWQPRKDKLPKCCPRCKSPNWNRTDLSTKYDFQSIKLGETRNYPMHRIAGSMAPDERKNINMTKALNSYRKRNPSQEFETSYIDFKMIVKRIL